MITIASVLTAAEEVMRHHHVGQAIHHHHVRQDIPHHRGQEVVITRRHAPVICRAERSNEFFAAKVIAEYGPKNAQAVAIHFMQTEAEIDGVFG